MGPLLYIILVVFIQHMSGKPFRDSEHVLMEHIFNTTYAKEIRPVRNRSRPVQITFGIAYVQLCSLDDAEQVLTSNIWVRQSWFNELLTWDPLVHGNITEINVHPSFVWVPDITLYNNAIQGKFAGTLYNFRTKVKVRYDGKNTWYAPAILKSSCPIDITWFPFDYQECPLEFGSWSFHGLDVDINLDADQADLKFYVESSDFELIKAPAFKKINKFSCCPEPYPILRYTIVISRIPGFHFFHIILPAIFMTFMTVASFVAPHMNGERVVLTIESFLTLSFSLLLVSEEIPVNSDITPMINKLILACMSFQGAILFCNILTAHINGNHPVPLKVRIVCFEYVAPCIGMGGYHHFVTPTLVEDSRVLKHNFKIFTSKVVNIEEESQAKAVTHLREMINMDALRKEREDSKMFWCLFTKTLDRTFLLSFSVIYVFSSLAIFTDAYANRWRI